MFFVKKVSFPAETVVFLIHMHFELTFSKETLEVHSIKAMVKVAQNYLGLKNFV